MLPSKWGRGYSIIPKRAAALLRDVTAFFPLTISCCCFHVQRMGGYTALRPVVKPTLNLYLNIISFFFFAPPEKKNHYNIRTATSFHFTTGKKMKGSRVITYPINIGQRHTNTPRLAWNPFFLVVCPPFHFISGSCFYDDSGVYVHSRAFFSLSLSSGCKGNVFKLLSFLVN